MGKNQGRTRGYTDRRGTDHAFEKDKIINPKQRGKISYPAQLSLK
jgi:hypothetical protein